MPEKPLKVIEEGRILDLNMSPGRHFHHRYVGNCCNFKRNISTAFHLYRSWSLSHRYLRLFCQYLLIFLATLPENFVLSFYVDAHSRRSTGFINCITFLSSSKHNSTIPVDSSQSSSMQSIRILARCSSTDAHLVYLFVSFWSLLHDIAQCYPPTLEHDKGISNNDHHSYCHLFDLSFIGPLLPRRYYNCCSTNLLIRPFNQYLYKLSFLLHLSRRSHHGTYCSTDDS